MHQKLATFDRFISSLIQRLPAVSRPLFQLASWLGEPFVVLCVGLAYGLVMLGLHLPHPLLLPAIGFFAFCANTGIKYYVQRARPDTIYTQNMLIKSYSFPSGHAFGATFFYGLWAIAAMHFLTGVGGIIAAFSLGSLILLIGLSRVFLQAHFPSDVVVGWLFGGISLSIAVWIVGVA